MADGPIHEGAKAAGGVVDALKGQPVLLVAVLFAFASLGLTAYEASSFNAQRGDFLKMVIESQREVSVLLAQCQPANK